MASKNNGTRADKAATDTKKKKTTSNSTGKSKKPVNKTPKVSNLDFMKAFPDHVIIAVVSLALFVLLLVTAVNPDGWILKVIRSIAMGLLGRVGFYFSIPALAYLFVIHTFGRRTKVRMRTWCTVAFIFFCGCISI